MINDTWYKHKKVKSFVIFVLEFNVWLISACDVQQLKLIQVHTDWHECVAIGRKIDLFLTNELYVCRRWWYYGSCSDLPCNLCFATLWNNCKRRIRGYLYMFRCLNTEINRILRDLPKKRKELLLKYNYYS